MCCVYYEDNFFFIISLKTCDNVINVALDYERLKGNLPHGRVRWSEPIVALASKLIGACVDFLKNNLVSVVSTEKFREFGSVSILVKHLQ